MSNCVNWSFFTALLCLFNKGSLVWSDCNDRNVEMIGGSYSLSDGFMEDSKLTYYCEEGFYPYPDAMRICTYSGTWEPAPQRSVLKRPACRPVECPDPAVLDNCNVSPSQTRYHYKDEITYQCYEGHTLVGPYQRTCLANGKWSGSHPVCRRNSGDYCPDPGVPPGASRTATLFDIGEKVTYSCIDSKMILIGSDERVCQEDGHWSGKEPTCYYPYTYDTPLEVSLAFSRGIKHTFASLETNVTQEGRTIRLSESGIFNIFIALDVSSSIKDKDFQMAKEAVTTLIEKIAAISVSPNYDIMFFSSKVIPVIDILTFYGNNRKPLHELVNLLRNFPKLQKHEQAGTNLNATFNKIHEKISVIKRRQTNFAEHHHAIIVFTDGQLNMGGKPTDIVESIKRTVLMGQEAKRKDHLDIYIFGIGNPVYDKNIKDLGYGTGDKHYFRLENLDKLSETLDEMINEEDIKSLCGLHRNDTYKHSPNKRWKHPWALNIKITTEDAKLYNCIGSLVSARFVLTAAHCFTVDGFIKDVKVEYGGQLLGVDFNQTVIHPLYNIKAKEAQGIKEFYDYDVALLKLTKDVDFSSSLRRICLPCTEETKGVLGRTFNCTEQEKFLITNNQRVNFLTMKKTGLDEKYAHVRIEDRSDCIRKSLTAEGLKGLKDIISTDVVTENFLCTGGGMNKEIDQIACKGDSGGAVFRNYFHRTIQLAVVSWGTQEMEVCAKKQIPFSNEDSRDFHINLFKVKPFLKSVLGKEGQDYAPIEFID